MGRDSSVGIATCHGLEGAGFEYRWAESEIFRTHPDRSAELTPFEMGTGSCARG
jgi:hypothetical protein